MAKDTVEAPDTETKVVDGNGPDTTSNGVVEIDLAKATKRTMTLNLPDQLREAIDAAATKRDVPANYVAREILAAHFGMHVVETPKAAAIVGLSKEQRAEVRKREAAGKRERADEITAAILSGTLPVDVLEKYGLGHLVPKTSTQIVAEVLAGSGVPTDAPAEVVGTPA